MRIQHFSLQLALVLATAVSAETNFAAEVKSEESNKHEQSAPEDKQAEAKESDPKQKAERSELQLAIDALQEKKFQDGFLHSNAALKTQRIGTLETCLLLSIRGTCLVGLTKYAEAVADFERCANLEKSLSTEEKTKFIGMSNLVCTGQAVCYVVLGQLEKALHCLDKSIKLRPDDAFDNHMLKCQIYLAIKDFDQARLEAELASKSNPESTLAKTYSKMSDKSKLKLSEQEEISRICKNALGGQNSKEISDLQKKYAPTK